MSLTSVNPADGKLLKTYEEPDQRAVEACIQKSHTVFLEWKRAGFSQRSSLLRNAARVLMENRGSYARRMALEMGKPIRDGRAEIEKCAWVCDYYADNAERMLEAEPAESDADKSFVAFQPLGATLAVMPWNYPFWQVFRYAAPALMAGNTVLLKHAANVCGCALDIEKVFQAADYPACVFQTLLIGSDRVAAIIDNPSVKAVTLTGSKAAGQAVAARAGQGLKKSVLELGGSDPYLILEDAELAPTVDACVTSRLLNSGQSCIAAKRFIVVDSVREEFETRLVEKMRQKILGDPLDDTVDIGPQARIDLRDDLHRQVSQSVSKGARCLLGGEIPDRPGAWYPLTVLTDVRAGMPVFEEETFGPVAAVISVASEAEAIRIANNSAFGLGAAVFTRDTQRGERIATFELEAGNCFVNAFVRSDPRLPFGGIKESGYGRELSHHGIKEFMNIKTVYVDSF
jgi:succinate-semialdehyde dehydrogenase/glutarate-semialdehyde dehydrogenase